MVCWLYLSIRCAFLKAPEELSGSKSNFLVPFLQTTDFVQTNSTCFLILEKWNCINCFRIFQKIELFGNEFGACNRSGSLRKARQGRVFLTPIRTNPWLTRNKIYKFHGSYRGLALIVIRKIRPRIITCQTGRESTSFALLKSYNFWTQTMADVSMNSFERSEGEVDNHSGGDRKTFSNAIANYFPIL